MENEILEAGRNDSIQSESIALKCARLFFAVLILLMIVGLIIANLFSDRLQYSKDRKAAKKAYDTYYDEVNSFIENERKNFRNKSGDDPDLGDKLADAFTLGLWSYADPRSYDDENEYVIKQIYLRYFELLATKPAEVIGVGLVKEKSYDEIIDDLIENEKDNRWSNANDNILEDISAIIILSALPVLITAVVVIRRAAKKQKTEYLNVTDGNVFFSDWAAIQLSDVIRAETGFPKKVTIVTAAGSYKRRFIRNNREIAQFINERCSNAAQ